MTAPGKTSRSPLDSPGVIAIIYVAAGLAVYGRNLFSFFLADDFFFLESARAGTMFTMPAGIPGQFVRPVSMFTIWLDGKVWGLHPFGYHLSAFVLHLAN